MIPVDKDAIGLLRVSYSYVAVTSVFDVLSLGRPPVLVDHNPRHGLFLKVMYL